MSFPATRRLRSQVAAATPLRSLAPAALLLFLLPIRGSGQAGPAAYWPFDETDGATAHDASGHGHDGAVDGAAWSDGIQNGALRFDGVDDAVDLGPLDVPAGSSGFSVSVWFRAESFNESMDNRLVSKTTGVSGKLHYWMLSTMEKDGSPVLRFRLKTNGSTTTLLADSDIVPAEQWVHAVATYDGQTMRIYQDNEEVASTGKTGAVSTNPDVPAAIGSNPGGKRPWHGKIDEVLLYDRALSAAEIDSLFHAVADDPSPPGAPADLAVILATASRIDLTWSSASDPESGISFYNIFRDGGHAGSPAATFFSDAGLEEDTEYLYEVSAVNGAGLEGPRSLPLLATTLPDSGGPSAAGGLVGFWKLDDGSGATASDASGNGHDGLVDGASWTQGIVGGALHFDGDDDGVDLGSLDVPTEGPSGLSIAAWFKADSFNSSRDNRILSKTTDSDGDSHYWMLSTIKSAGKTVLRFRLKTGGSTQTLIAGGGSIDTGEWVHAAATYDGQAMRLYEDNVIVASRPATGNVSASGSVPAAIGRNPDGTDPWHGTIDEIRLYGRGITAPASDPTWESSSSPAALGGNAWDDVGVAGVTWTNAPPAKTGRPREPRRGALPCPWPRGTTSFSSRPATPPETRLSTPSR